MLEKAGAFKLKRIDEDHFCQVSMDSCHFHCEMGHGRWEGAPTRSKQPEETKALFPVSDFVVWTKQSSYMYIQVLCYE